MSFVVLLFELIFANLNNGFRIFQQSCEAGPFPSLVSGQRLYMLILGGFGFLAWILLQVDVTSSPLTSKIRQKRHRKHSKLSSV